MEIKEPQLMRELHKIREKLAKRWNKMNDKEFLETLHDSKKWYKSEIATLQSVKTR